jgi:hypothetical protein
VAFIPPKEKLTATSLRECKFYYDYIKHLDHSIDSDSLLEIITEPKTAVISKYLDELEAIIHEKIKCRTFKYNERYKLINHIKVEFEKTQLSTEDFSLLNTDNQRLFNWIWCLLKNYTPSIIDSENSPPIFYDILKKISPSELKRTHPYSSLNNESFKTNPHSCSKRVSDIKDSFKNSEVDKEGQLEIIKLIATLWGEMFKFEDFVKWFNTSDETQVDWSWQYINASKYRQNFQYWNPHEKDETAAAVIAVIDIGMFENQDRTELLLSNMRRAWSQKKFRDKNEGKKAYSISMTKETKEKLDSLVEVKGLKINETIEQLIRSAFEKQNSKSQP